MRLYHVVEGEVDLARSMDDGEAASSLGDFLSLVAEG